MSKLLVDLVDEYFKSGTFEDCPSFDDKYYRMHEYGHDIPLAALSIIRSAFPDKYPKPSADKVKAAEAIAKERTFDALFSKADLSEQQITLWMLANRSNSYEFNDNLAKAAQQFKFTVDDLNIASKCGEYVGITPLWMFFDKNAYERNQNLEAFIADFDATKFNFNATSIEGYDIFTLLTPKIGCDDQSLIDYKVDQLLKLCEEPEIFNSIRFLRNNKALEPENENNIRYTLAWHWAHVSAYQNRPELFLKWLEHAKPDIEVLNRVPTNKWDTNGQTLFWLACLSAAKGHTQPLDYILQNYNIEQLQLNACAESGDLNGITALGLLFKSAIYGHNSNERRGFESYVINANNKINQELEAAQFKTSYRHFKLLTIRELKEQINSPLTSTRINFYLTLNEYKVLRLTAANSAETAEKNPAASFAEIEASLNQLLSATTEKGSFDCYYVYAQALKHILPEENYIAALKKVVVNDDYYNAANQQLAEYFQAKKQYLEAFKYAFKIDQKLRQPILEDIYAAMLNAKLPCSHEQKQMLQKASQSPEEFINDIILYEKYTDLEKRLEQYQSESQQRQPGAEALSTSQELLLSKSLEASTTITEAAKPQADENPDKNQRARTLPFS